MSSYKDSIIPGLPDKNSKKNTTKPEIKKDEEKDEVTQIIDSYINMLKEDATLIKRNQIIFDHFDELSGEYRNGAYQKMYQTYLKYINDETKSDIMQINILRTIESYYKKQVRELAKKENELICQQNGHNFEPNWTRGANGWTRKCLVCGKKQTRSTDPNVKNKPDTPDKGIQRGRRKK